jgi:pimeloyl-ACP methyl ester carboxylesterase
MTAARVLRLLALAALAALTLGLLPAVAAAAAPTHITGTSSDGSRYLIEVPPGWNGTLLLYSHGYSFTPLTVPTDSPDNASSQPVIHDWLLAHGFALAGSTYANQGTGWSLESAFPDQIDVLDAFGRTVGRPARTIAWGHSLGGMITAGLVQLHPERFQGALPMCGVLAGGVGVWNQALDSAFAFKTLLAPGSGLELVHITNAAADLGAALGILDLAQASSAGRARVALAAALADVPGWYDPAAPEPAAKDFTGQELNQASWLRSPDLLFSFLGRQELEHRAGGNPSWNTGVDYRRQLARSTDREEVAALYHEAGLSLEDDLSMLDRTARINADAGAVDYLSRFIVYDGELGLPVLTLHTTGDGLVEVTGENAYASVVRAAGDSRLLRETFVHRAGHCTFTAAETIAALRTLMGRLDTGRWDDRTSPAAMNRLAASLGPALNAVPSAFVQFHPARFLRPFDARSEPEGEP